MSKKPLIKPAHRGLLHRDLGVPQGQPIPVAKEEAAAHASNPTLRKRAQFALNFNHPDDLDSARQSAARGLFHARHPKRKP